jgi:hypothetical protein
MATNTNSSSTKGKGAITLPQNASELTIGQLKNQVEKIQQVMRSVMKEGVHYGRIAGVPQQFLWKAGAEKLCMTFRFKPEFTIDKTVHEGYHVTYDITCDLIHLPSGTYVGQGVGSASTLEKKYRYRNEDLPTGVEVPSAWWQKRDKSNLPKILKNNGVEPKAPSTMKKQGLELAAGKVDGKMQIVYRKKIENPDVPDLYNTVVKMAKKRALVDATITALAVGDMFSQDPEAVDESFEEPETEQAAAPKSSRSTSRSRSK